MYERAFILVNTINCLIILLLVTDIKKGGWVSEMVFGEVVFKYFIPILLFATNFVLNVIFSPPSGIVLLTFLVLLVPIVDLLKQQVDHGRTSRLYRIHEESIRKISRGELINQSIDVSDEDIKVFLTNQKESFKKQQDKDSCHVVVWLDDCRYSDVKEFINEGIPGAIQSNLEKNIEDITFDVCFRIKNS